MQKPGAAATAAPAAEAEEQDGARAHQQHGAHEPPGKFVRWYVCGATGGKFVRWYVRRTKTPRYVNVPKVTPGRTTKQQDATETC